MLSKTEYEFAKLEASRPTCSTAIRHAFEVNSSHRQSGKACVIEGVHGLLDGVTLHPAPGHTPGHLRIEVRSQGALGLFVGDILHSADSSATVAVEFAFLFGTPSWLNRRGATSSKSVPAKMAFCSRHTSKFRTLAVSGGRTPPSPSISAGR